MTDESHLDDKYFIDDHIYNCPFCKRGHVRYELSQYFLFDWSNTKDCWVYFVTCASCRKVSMHLSYERIHIKDSAGHLLGLRADIGIDATIFYSVPTSYFAIDSRIPKLIREMIAEAEGCTKMNHLTGASACTRKAIYELLVHEKHTEGSYDDRITALKAAHPEVDSELFDIISHVKDMTSEKVHEQSWDKWDSPHLELILEALKTVLHELYVVPAERKNKVAEIARLREQVKTKSTLSEPSPPDGT